ncbi:MAG: energy-coupling factor transporter ATPase [Bacillota bacterium]|nr:energy-coupling factor transporter ATPase [Bacillota bacterium]
MIKIEDVYFKYNDHEDEKYALKAINLHIKPGEFVAIIGHNGSGKSTLAKLLNGLYMPTAGDIFIKGMNTKDEDKIWDIREAAGMVFQNPDNQIVTTIVEEEIAFGPENIGLPREEIRKRIDYALKVVEMEKYLHHAPHLLSGGQKQRIAIAGILAMNPSCIILDEPTAMLDPTGRKEVIDTVYRLNEEEKKTILLITHNMEETVGADRVIVMNKGQVYLEGSPREIFSKVQDLKEIGLDVPAVTELAYKLNQDGFLDDYKVLNIEELVERIC